MGWGRKDRLTGALFEWHRPAVTTEGRENGRGREDHSSILKVRRGRSYRFNKEEWKIGSRRVRLGVKGGKWTKKRRD